jgi:hypothetical protein
MLEAVCLPLGLLQAPLPHTNRVNSPTHKQHNNEQIKNPTGQHFRPRMLRLSNQVKPREPLLAAIWKWNWREAINWGCTISLNGTDNSTDWIRKFCRHSCLYSRISCGQSSIGHKGRPEMGEIYLGLFLTREIWGLCRPCLLRRDAESASLLEPWRRKHRIPS